MKTENRSLVYVFQHIALRWLFVCSRPVSVFLSPARPVGSLAIGEAWGEKYGCASPGSSLRHAAPLYEVQARGDVYGWFLGLICMRGSWVSPWPSCCPARALPATLSSRPHCIHARTRRDTRQVPHCVSFLQVPSIADLVAMSEKELTDLLGR